MAQELALALAQELAQEMGRAHLQEIIVIAETATTLQKMMGAADQELFQKALHPLTILALAPPHLLQKNHP